MPYLPRSPVRPRFIRARYCGRSHLAVWTMVLAVAGLVLPACGGEPDENPIQAVGDAKDCLASNGDSASAAQLIPTAGPGLGECVTDVMDEAPARRFLLGVGNAAISVWARNFARRTGERLTDVPGELLAAAQSAASLAAEQEGDTRELRDFYFAVADGLRANVNDGRDAAAELAGMLRLLSQQSRETALSTEEIDILAAGTAYATGEHSAAAAKAVGDARAHFSDAYDDSFNRLEDVLSIALWADPAVRTRLLAGEPSESRPPATPPPTEAEGGERIDPPLLDAQGVLRVPDVDDQPAHDVYFNWLERGGGRELGGLTRLATRDIDRIFIDVYRRIAAE